PATARWPSAPVLVAEAPPSGRADLLWMADACGDPETSLTSIEALGTELLARLERRLAAADAELARTLERRAKRELDLRANAYTSLGTLLGARRVRELAAAQQDDRLLAAV